ncbi:MAG: J domain-containing protein [Sulfuritalea sp.]|nr:J domain-containing protein [Sulfuritalea sp.]MDP1984387.1 J domain-containing protein [Sulfuritalea sp.]
MKRRKKNHSLFDEGQPASVSRGQAIVIGTGVDKPQLSKAQKAFNTLIKQIENERARLLAWETAIPAYQKKYTTEMLPLVAVSEDLRVEMVHCLDRACERKDLSKAERRKLAQLIVELVGPLVAARADAELKAIYNKHSRSDYDKDVAAEIEEMKSMFGDDVEFGTDDYDDDSAMEETLRRAAEEIQEKRARDEAALGAREERRAQSKKSAKQLAREAKQQAEAQQVSQSIREVYRKLASALHPDREPDPRERERKTALMQRANQAYQKNNLLQLLELQLELEHIDQAALDNIGEDRLRHYNKVLKEQLAELSQEVFHVEARFRAQFDIDPFAAVAPATLTRHLASDIVELKHVIRDLKKDLAAFADIKAVKAWLKGMREMREMRHRPRIDDFDDCPF